MTKRSTEDVLRDEVKRATLDVERAKAAGGKARDARVAADRAEADREKELDAAREALKRAEAALAAFLPGELETAVDAVKERQQTTGTHDPADLKNGTESGAPEEAPVPAKTK